MVVTDIQCLKLFVTMNDIYKCAFCKEAMTEDEHSFCDICPECRDDPNRSESYE
jgi:Zn finger protein HypA/HybF involved in hydrogenase expression